MEVLCPIFILLVFLAPFEYCSEALPQDTLKPMEGENICFPYDDSKPSHLLFTGNSSAGPVPIMHFKVSEITSFVSEFELRTFDPEGIIFFGDLGGNRNWFLLALREKLLEIQIQNNVALTTVDGGPIISDGEWRKITVLKEDSSVIVKVADKTVVKVQEPGEQVEVNPHFDGCLRNWNWVQRDSSLLTQLLQSSETQRCWQNITPGSYFPGQGAAALDAQLFFMNFTTVGTGHWRLVLELYFRPVMDSGILFAVVDSQNNVTFSINMDQIEQTFVLTIRGEVFGTRSFPPGLCSGETQFLHLTLADNKLEMILGAEKEMRLVSADSFEALKSVWNQQGTMVYLGGLPDPYAPPSTSFFHGCLQMKIQGTLVDLDMATIKHGEIRSHSCPAALDLGDGK
ncbi:vitamin K-dependent protein S isoform X2 [Amia ocellicauda]|uniref:vitamin K-dependent protein S isoform X2 n=1 Tax=Amia ocellicauda TaxID=2972642 RepID=UPI0034642585